MITEIVARSAGFVDEFECLTAGFADSTDNDGFALLFQASTHEPDDQDLRLGFDTYCIVNGNGSGINYGGLQHAKLIGNELRLIFSPGIGSKFGITDDFRVRFEVNEQVLRQFREGFQQVVLVPWGRASEKPKLSGF